MAKTRKERSPLQEKSSKVNHRTVPIAYRNMKTRQKSTTTPNLTKSRMNFMVFGVCNLMVMTVDSDLTRFEINRFRIKRITVSFFMR